MFVYLFISQYCFFPYFYILNIVLYWYVCVLVCHTVAIVIRVHFCKLESKIVYLCVCLHGSITILLFVSILCTYLKLYVYKLLI